MTASISNNSFSAGRDNNYLVGGNVINALVVGEIGSVDDFFIVAAEPELESNYPLITGNILDSEGKVLFRLVRNVLTLNPGHCSKISGNRIGYEIHDSAGQMIFKVETYFDEEAGCWITSIEGSFYDKERNLVMTASRENGIHIQGGKHALGFSGGGFGSVQGMSEEDLNFARIVLTSGGRVHTPLRGEIKDQEIILDGKALLGAHLKNCTVHIHTGNWALYGSGGIQGCRIIFYGEADNIKHLVQALLNNPTNIGA